MEDNILKHGMRFLLKQKRRKRWQKVVGFLACLVVFCTSYALILPAITMEATAYCGKEHVHDDSCYETSKTLICGLEEQTETAAAENLAETASSENETQETETIGAAHVHTEECYQYEKVLVCTLEEHTHTQECYSDKNADVETASDWENALPALTGKRASDLILVAESQIGYRESGINYEVVGTDTLKGYTRYGAWYGQPYGDWSGMFAAFCLNYAGIPQSIFPYDADCQQWADILAQSGMFAAAGSYTPKAGDIAFLDTDGTPGIERVGIIRDVSEEGAITTIEGDARDTVQYGNYTLNSENVKGYGILPEEDTPETTAEETSQATPEEDAKMLEADGEDYKITVTYDESAGIPDGAILKVSEYSQDSEEYATRFEQANTVLLEQDGSCIRRARFFNISIMDGETEIEPESTVKVEISQSSEITEAAGDIVITHATDEGTEVISEVEQTQEENGYVTTSFETESFSDYGTINAGESATISVGDTVTLKGTASKGGTVNEWTLSSVGIVTIEQSGTNDAIITGTNAGTVTITHEYSTKKNKTAKETFTVTVTDNGGSGGDDTGEETEKEAAGTGYTVTVKGNKNVLTDDVTLHVEDYNETESDYEGYFKALIGDLQNQFEDSQSITEEDFDFLHMYHIYLTKEGTEGEYIPEGNINLQVTITYADAPEGWPSKNGNLYVGHYKKANETISSEAISDDDSTSIGVKQIKVSGNSITFHIQSFSVFPVIAFGKSSDNESIIPPGEATITENDDVRLHKWAEATETENEFLVHLSIDTTSVTKKFDEFLKNATYVAGSASHFPDGIVAGGLGDLQGSEKDTNGNKPYTITLTYQEKVVGTAVVNMEISNGCLYLKLNPNGGHNDTVYIALAELKKEQTVNTELSPEAYEMLVKHVENTDYTDGLSVEDIMGPAIIYLNSASGDGTVIPDTAVSELGTKITWIPKIKSELTGTQDSDDENKIWYENAAELTYRIKLDVTIDSFVNGAEEIAEGKSFVENNLTEEQAKNLKVNAVNQSAKLTYNSTEGIEKTLDFPIPYVRGLTYTFNFTKVDATDDSKFLEGAEFKLVSDDMAYTAISGQNGVVTFSNIPWGEYTLIETKAPGGYILDTNKSFSLPIIGYVEDMKDGELNNHVYNADVSTTNYVWNGIPKITTDENEVKNIEWVYEKTSASDWKVENTPGKMLPATGGAGTLPYTFGGLGLILASGLMYGYSMRRRRERRSR